MRNFEFNFFRDHYTLFPSLSQKQTNETKPTKHLIRQKRVILKLNTSQVFVPSKFNSQNDSPNFHK